MPVDPEDMPPDVREWTKQRKAAEARQARAKANLPAIAGLDEHDEARRAAAERQRNEIMSRNTTPASLTGGADDPFDIPDKLTASVPEDLTEAQPKPPAANQAAKPPNDRITFWVAICDGRPIYAESWEALKVHLKDIPGTWEAIEHNFQLTHKNLLGFFGCHGYKVPEKSIKAKFEVIVQNGKVFKSE